MTPLKPCRKWLDRLEEHPSTEPDIVGMVLRALSDQDLELQEHATMLEAGFDEEEISFIMSNRWMLFQQAIERFKEAAIELASR